MSERGHGSVGGDAETVRIRLLGGFRVSVGDRTVRRDSWRMRKAASLVKLLALASGHHLHREQAMETLWPGLGRRAASNNLRQALHAARRTLDPDLIGGSRYLASEGESLVLCPEGRLWVDSEAFEEAARNAHRSREPAAYEVALDLYAGELLPGDRYEEWAEGHRRRLRDSYLSLLLGLARLHEDRAAYDSAAEALKRALKEEPTLEEAHAGLMRLYALAGSKGEALAQYERLEEVLSSELGTEPSASSRALREEIAVGRFPPTDAHPFGYASEEPHVASKHNLPASRSSFVGREREMIEVKRALAMTRLLTLTGTGGSGKTRLALEVARELVGAYTDGVWLVELAPLSEGTLVAQAVATVLGVQEQPERPLTDTLVDFLRSKQALLVLDNCEHLVDTVARLADILLNSSPHLRVLATSRESLNVEGELTWLVPSLSAPSLGDAPTVEELAGYESVRLFVERARHRNPAFALTSENAHAVAKICGRLDGIPLAIELAAARVGLSLEQIATRLDDSLKLLTAGSRTASPRQRTLRGALDWSYTLLSAHEQMLFGRLSIFAGGWTLEAAEVVGAEGDIEQRDILDILSRLVEKSLVVAEATGGGGVRYRMLEPVRQYAQEKLEEGGEAEEVRHRHASFFLALAEEAEPRLRGPEDLGWLERLETEHDNLRAALSWALVGGEAELGLRLAGALWTFWEARGYYGEGLAWLKRVLARGDRVSAARIKALEGEGWLIISSGEIDEAGIAARDGLKLSDEAGLGGAVSAKFLRILGWIANLEGDLDRAKELFEECLKLSQDANDELGIADAILGLACSGELGDDFEREEELHKEGIVLCRKLGYVTTLTRHLSSLGYRLLFEGEYERGAALSEEAAALLRERGYTGGLEGDLGNLGLARLLQSDNERARISFQEGLILCKELGNKLDASGSLDGLACISATEGAAERAARLFGAGEALREAIGHVHVPEEAALLEPYLATVRSQLDEASWQGAWEEGRAMSMDQAIDYALSEEKPTSPISSAPERLSADEVPQLTRREKEIAALVAQGFSSRQIASKLVVSERTVDNHVANVLKKLSLHSREQIAARMAERSPRRD
jgi:predicted ATPase/DNA-binding SARP family transcriptional activator/DNA-binding CsgD family transcriptional regulator